MTRRWLGGTGESSPDERAVSDVVGYVLVFALVTATLAAVFTIGFVGLEERQNAERVENVERAFDVLGDNIRDIQRYEDPSRATEIRLNGGSMSLETHTELVLEYENASGTFEYQRITMSTLTYSNGERTVAYEGGAWFRADGDRGTMRSPPRFVAEDGQTVLPVVRLLDRGERSTVRGDETVQVGAETRGSRTLRYPDPESGNVTEIRLRIESPYADAWRTYFETETGFSAVSTPSNNEVVATVEEDQVVYLRVIGIDISFRQ